MRYCTQHWGRLQENLFLELFTACPLSFNIPTACLGCSNWVLPEWVCGRNIQGRMFDSVTLFNGTHMMRIPRDEGHPENAMFPSHIPSNISILWAFSSASFGAYWLNVFGRWRGKMIVLIRGQFRVSTLMCAGNLHGGNRTKCYLSLSFFLATKLFIHKRIII